MSERISTDIQTIIWDLDGTLLDSFGILAEILGEILPRHGLAAPPIEVLAHHFHGRLEDVIRGVAPEVDERQLQAIHADLLILDNAYIRDVDNHLFSDAVDLARRANELDIKQIIITNRAHGSERLNASPRTMVQNSALRNYITAVLCGDDSEYRKPDREVLRAQLDSGLVVPEKTLVIGDQFVDAEFAHNLSARAILVARGGVQVPHLERLADNWESWVTIVPSLAAVHV